MLPPGLRWSLSDIVLAIQVIHKVSHAIRNADRADQQYSASIAFLDAFARTIERIKKYIESDKDEIVQHGEDLMVQMTLILTEYTKFDDYLKKCESGLSSMSFVKRITAQTRLALEEVNQKVTDLKKAVLSPMMFITPLLAVETLYTFPFLGFVSSLRFAVVDNSSKRSERTYHRYPPKKPPFARTD
jgi:hypothetical protein